MYVCFAYKNGEIKVRRIKRFSDLSTDNSDFYYYEEELDAWGQGTCVRKDEILCIEIAPYPKADWPEETKKERHSPIPAVKPAVNPMDPFLDNRPYR